MTFNPSDVGSNPIGLISNVFMLKFFKWSKYLFAS